MSVVAGVTCTGAADPPERLDQRARRSANGRPVRSSSPSASRSNATYDAGVSAASRRTRESAGWIRCCSTSNSSRPSTATTISPSTTQRSGSSALNASTSSGKYRVIGFSLREPISTSSPSRNTTDRKPSHFGSYDAPAGISGTALASIGATGGMTGSCMPSIMPAANFDEP